MKVRYRNGDEVYILELQGDPFAVCDHVQRKLFPVLLEDGWQRLLAHRARAAEQDITERSKS